jgi:8-oxo-dGTP pyrophosphatase MutT (NUDIX family)
MSRFASFAGRAVHAAVHAAYQLRRATWFVARPNTRGAHAVAFDTDGRLVLVRLSYARGWRLPGGGLKKGEGPQEAVLRELTEEIGMVSHGAVRKVTDFDHRPDFKRDLATLFMVEDVRYRPSWNLEVKEVRAFAIDALPWDTSPSTLRLLKVAGVH